MNTIQEGSFLTLHYHFAGPDGVRAFAGVVREVGEGRLLFDFNHPLAGRPVIFEVQVIGVR